MPADDWVPIRTFRCADELWQAAQRAASDRGETVTDVLLRALERYVRDWPGHSPD